MPFPPCDVIIPARNAAARLARAISSVLAQTAPDLRLIIVDDGSRDATPDIACMRAATSARLLRAGRIRAAKTLAPIALLPQTVLRAATGRLYWIKHPV